MNDDVDDNSVGSTVRDQYIHTSVSLLPLMYIYIM